MPAITTGPADIGAGVGKMLPPRRPSVRRFRSPPRQPRGLAVSTRQSSQPTGERAAKACGHGIPFRAKPTMRFDGAPVAAAAGDVIDTAVACQARAKRVLALDFAARRLERVVGEEFSASIGGTVRPEQCRADLPTLPEIVRSQEASPPDAKGALSRFALVVCEATEGIDVNGPTLPHEPALKVDATHGAIADTALRKLRIGAEVATDDGAVRDKLLKRFDCK